VSGQRGVQARPLPFVDGDDELAVHRHQRLAVSFGADAIAGLELILGLSRKLARH
jgi:hypothetical protein